jgi:hypothetical protein
MKATLLLICQGKSTSDHFTTKKYRCDIVTIIDAPFLMIFDRAVFCGVLWDRRYPLSITWAHHALPLYALQVVGGLPAAVKLLPLIPPTVLVFYHCFGFPSAVLHPFRATS